jgi:hypothetical protein
MPPTSGAAVVQARAPRFSDARRVLNTIAGRYLRPLRKRWFGLGVRSLPGGSGRLEGPRIGSARNPALGC